MLLPEGCRAEGRRHPVRAGREDGDALVGSALASPGDVDGDGRPDLLIGGAGDTSGGAAAGEAWVFTLPGTGRHTIDEAQLRVTAEAGDEAGTAVSGAGDVDGDGLSDLVVGAPGSGTAALLRVGDFP